MLAALQAPFNGITERHAAFVGDLGSLAPEQLDFQPRAGAWSLGEVAQHLALVEEKTARVLAEKRVTGVARRRVLDVVYRQPGLDLYFVTGWWRAKMPVRGVAPEPAVPLAATIARWTAARERLAAYLDAIEEGSCRTIVYRHPVGGYMDIFATLRFLTQHHDHHMRQARRIKSAPGFPAAS
jgi:hypothetical protein